VKPGIVLDPVNGIKAFGQLSGVAGEGNIGVSGTSKTGFGVQGESMNSTQSIGVVGHGPTGVWGLGAPDPDTGNAIGVLADGFGVSPAVLAQGDHGSGVTGLSNLAPGVTGISSNSFGSATYGVSGEGDAAGVQGQSTNVGVFGETVNDKGLGPVGVLGQSTNSVGVWGFSKNGIGVAGSSDGSLAGLFIGPVFIRGNLTGTGVKGAVVPHVDGSHRLLCAIESPESWFEDFGEAALKDGQAEVQLDPDFAAVVSSRSPV